MRGPLGPASILPGRTTARSWLRAGAAAALAAGALGLAGLAAGEPWLLPSIGASVYLLACDRRMPASQPWNVAVGHWIALAAGVAVVAVLAVDGAPLPTAGGELGLPRLLASLLALGLTVLLTLAARAFHPPAGATALLVTLGVLDTPRESIALAVAALLVALASAALRGLDGRLPLLASPRAAAEQGPGTPAPNALRSASRHSR